MKCLGDPSAIFDGFPIADMVGIASRYADDGASEYGGLSQPHRFTLTRREWFALLRKPGQPEERVQIPDVVIAEMQRSNPDGSIFRIHHNEPDPGPRLQAEINEAAERVAEGYLNTPQRYILGVQAP